MTHPIICPECRRAGTRSTCHSTDSFITTYHTNGEEYWDENGRGHIHNTSTSDRQFRCSAGHQFSATLKTVWCKSCGTTETVEDRS